MTDKTSLTLAYSTCPNDTFLFHALATGLIDLKGLSYSIALDDVESLNQKARKGVFDISKLSFAAMGHLQDSYGLLRSGAALGRGCGPLVIARPDQAKDLKTSKDVSIAVPGLYTTANLLLGLFLGRQVRVTPMVFDEVMPAVASGQYDFGVIIHEGRFTFPSYGLCQVVDLGAWWETETGLPIPLGGIAVKRNLPPQTIETIERSISQSVSYAFEHPDESKDYVKQHAQELADDVIRQHINLYVNEFTVNLGPDGTEAVKHFFNLARSNGVLPHSSKPLFAC